MKQLYFLTFITLLLTATPTHAQKEGNIWHFGEGAALDFNSGAPVVTTPSAIWTYEGSASISDADGHLLFYTNGGGRVNSTPGQIWNRNHQVMYDMGGTEGGGFSAGQSSVIIPKPGAPGRYYLFTMEETESSSGSTVPGQPFGRGLSYFEIDMALNAGLGGVASYTAMVYVPTYEGLCAVRHANGIDYYIIVNQSDHFGLVVFPVTASGVGMPTSFPTAAPSRFIIKASPDGKWVSTYGPGGVGQYLSRFDPATGLLSPPQLIAGDIKSTEFSPDSKRFFTIANNKEVTFYDLTAPDINASKTVVGSTSGNYLTGEMQLAPDGALYFIENSLSKDSVFLSAIVCPNTRPFLNLEIFAYPSTFAFGFLGLPNFDNAIFRNDSYPLLPVNLGDDRTLCGAETATLTTGVDNATYQWSTGASTGSLLVATAGTYTVTVTGPGCSFGIDSIRINHVDLVPANAGPDLDICTGEPLQLTGMGTGALAWEPDSLVSDPSIATPDFIGDESATLILTAIKEGCTSHDTLQVSIHEYPDATLSPVDTTVTYGNPVQLTGMGAGTVSWSPTDGLSCEDCLNPLATPEDTTTYVLTITSDAGCTSTAMATLRVKPPYCEPDYPNAFTPNGDGANDVFQPYSESIESFNLTVYDRWGQIVFQGDTPWDGRKNGQEAASDVYVYHIDIRLCGKEVSVTKEVTLLR